MKLLYLHVAVNLCTFHVMSPKSFVSASERKPRFTPRWSVAEIVHVCLCAEVKKEAEEGDEPRAETESESEEELSCFAPTVRLEK